jgi:hypothetical protein
LGWIWNASRYERIWLKSAHASNSLGNDNFSPHSLSYGSIFGSADQTDDTDHTDHRFSKSGKVRNRMYRRISNGRIVSMIEGALPKFIKNYRWLFIAKIDFSVIVISDSICLHSLPGRSSIPQLGMGEWFQSIMSSSDQVPAWKVVACGKLTSRMHDTSHIKKMARNPFFSADFGAVSCWETSEAWLREHDRNHNENISSRMFDIEPR